MTPDETSIFNKIEKLIEILLKQEDILLKIEQKIDHNNQELTQAVQAIAKTLDAHLSEFISAVMGKDQFPMKVGMTVIKTLSMIIIALFVVLIFALTGMKLNLLPILPGAS